MTAEKTRVHLWKMLSMQARMRTRENAARATNKVTKKLRSEARSCKIHMKSYGLQDSGAGGGSLLQAQGGRK